MESDAHSHTLDSLVNTEPREAEANRQEKGLKQDKDKPKPLGFAGHLQHLREISLPALCVQVALERKVCGTCVSSSVRQL